MALPPAPLQVRAKVVLFVKVPVDWLPVVAFAPDQPPDARQDVAFDDDQFSVALPPLATTLGPTLNTTVGVAGAATVTVLD